MKTIKYTMICLVAFLLWNGMVNGQSDSTKYKKHRISLDYNCDFIMRESEEDGSTHYNLLYAYRLMPFLDNKYSYSIGLNYRYYFKKYFFIKSNLYYRNQISRLGMHEVKINGALKIAGGGNKTQLRYLDIPIGFGFSFFNKRVVRPYIEAGINTSFLFYEKIDCRFYDYPVTGHYDEVILSDNRLKYYNLKVSMNIGCEFYIHKKYVLGIDVNMRTIPIFEQNQNTIIYHLKYSNYGFGLSFGYVIK